MATTDAAIPLHIAVIMDGNGRWAKARGLPRAEGHKKGVEALELFVKEADKLGVKYLTIFAFSTENWQRPQSEVATLMGLLRKYLKKELSKSTKTTVRYKFIGNISHLPADIRQLISRIEETTAAKDGIMLNIALSYGGREEIVSAACQIAQKVKDGALSLSSVDENTFAGFLYAPSLPYPDLLIRTSGEVRISNFLLWQMAYTEMVFVDTLWPDFSPSDLHFAIKQFQMRDRRFGDIKED